MALNLSSLSRNLSLYALAQAGKGLLMLGVSMSLARLLSRAEMGSYQQLWTVYILLSTIIVGGLPGSLLFFLPTLGPRSPSYLRLANLGMLALGMLAAGLLLACAGPVASGFRNPSLYSALAAFSLYAALTVSSLHLPHLLLAEGKHPLSGLFIFGQAATLALAVIVGAASGLALDRISWLMGLSALPWFLLGLVLLGRRLGRRLLAFDRSLLAPVARYSLDMGLVAIIFVLLQYLGHIVVCLRSSPAEYAIYRMGAMELPLVSMLALAVVTGLLPTLANRFKAGERAEFLRLVRGTTERLALVILPIFAFCFAVAPNAVSLLFSPKYLPSTPIFRVLLLVLPLRCGLFAEALQAMGRTGSVAKGWAAGFAVCLALTFPLLALLGLTGPALAYVAGHAVAGGFFFLAAGRTLKSSARQALDWRRLLLTFACAALPAVPAWLIVRRVAPAASARLQVAVLALAGAVYGGLYLAGILASRRLARRPAEPLPFPVGEKA